MTDSLDKFVVLIGSGRSGTTWLGSILDSFEKAEYFYEIWTYPDLDFGHPDLLRIKYPLTYWWSNRPNWAVNLERQILKAMDRLNFNKQAVQRSLRIHQPYNFKKIKPNVKIFKIVNMVAFALKIEEYAMKFNGQMQVIHIIRQPFAQLVSDIRQHSGSPEKAIKYIEDRVQFISRHPKTSHYHDLALKYQHGTWIEQMALLWWIGNEIMINNKELPTHLVVFEELCKNTHKEVEKIFNFLRWPMSDQTREHIDKTIGVTISQKGHWSIYKNAEETMSRWRKEISFEDYNRVQKLLDNCNLMRLWNEKDLLLQKS